MLLSWLKQGTLFLIVVIATSGTSIIGQMYGPTQINTLQERLPRDVVPEHYNLYLKPSINEGYFVGNVTIDIKCLKPTKTIVLHATEELNITDNVTIHYLGNEISTDLIISTISRNASAETMTIIMNEELQKEGLYELYLSFHGYMDDMNYYSPYAPTERPFGQHVSGSGGFLAESFENPYSEEKSIYAATVTFPRNARKTFPCFDEPSFKAVFEITVGRLKNMSALSVMPVENTIEDSTQEDWVFDHFAPTPPISTFSVGVIVSNFEKDEPIIITNSQGSYKVQFYQQKQTPINNKLQNDSSFVHDVMKHLEDYMGIPYPVPVLNVVLLPRFVYGTRADSLGLILYRDIMAYNLFPEVTKGFTNQWINHVVTPDWWNGFNVTRFLESFLTNSVEPKGQISYQIGDLYELFSTSNYYRFFDENNGNVLARGAWVFQMLNSTLTERTLKTAVRNFISNKKYNTFTEDMFWDELTQQAWEDGTLPKTITVNDIAKSWFRNDSYRFPVVRVTRDYSRNTANLEQQMFLQEFPHNFTDEENKTFWWIPIMYLTPDNLDSNSLQSTTWMKGEKYLEIENLPDAQSFIIVNPIDASMYLVNYDEHNWRLLSQALITSPPSLRVDIRKKLLRDALLLSKSGELNYGTALNMTLFLFNEPNYTVWTPFFTWFSDLQQHLSWTPVEDKLKVYIKRLLIPKVGSMDDTPDYTADQTYITFIYSARDALSRSDYKQKYPYYQYMYNSTGTAFIMYDNDTESDAYCQEFMRNISGDWKQYSDQIGFLVQSTYMGRNYVEKCPNFVELIERILNDTIDENKTFSSLIWYNVVNLLTLNPVSHNLTFNFFLKHFEYLRQRISFVEDTWTSLINAIVSKIKTPEVLEKWVVFYEQHKEKFENYKESIEQSMKIAVKEVEWINKNLLDIENWFNQSLPNFVQ